MPGDLSLDFHSKNLPLLLGFVVAVSFAPSLYPAGAPIARLLLLSCLLATMIAKAAASSSIRQPWRFLSRTSSSTHVATFASNEIRRSQSHPPSRVVRFFRADNIRNNGIVDVHRAAPPKPRTRTSIPGALRHQSGQRCYSRSSLSPSSSSSDMTANEVRMTQDAYDLSDYDDVSGLSFGRASADMALAVAEVLKSHADDDSPQSWESVSEGGWYRDNRGRSCERRRNQGAER